MTGFSSSAIQCRVLEIYAHTSFITFPSTHTHIYIYIYISVHLVGSSHTQTNVLRLAQRKDTHTVSLSRAKWNTYLFHPAPHHPLLAIHVPHLHHPQQLELHHAIRPYRLTLSLVTRATGNARDHHHDVTLHARLPPLPTLSLSHTHTTQCDSFHTRPPLSAHTHTIRVRLSTHNNTHCDIWYWYVVLREDSFSRSSPPFDESNSTR